MNDVFSFQDRTVAILGAGSDMGLAVAQGFGRAGAALFLGDVDETRLEAHRRVLHEEGLTAVLQRTDVTRRAEVESFVENAFAVRNRLDAMINLAGIITDVPALELTEAELDRVLAVNLKGVFFACQAAGRRMVEAGRGSIVNMASMGAFKPIPKLSAYSMSKAGVVALTRTLALELGASGVRVNAVAPGYIEGGMTQRHLRDDRGDVDPEQLAHAMDKARRRNPIGLTGTPDDIAQACLYLASDAARYVTGQVLHTNGGAFMP